MPYRYFGIVTHKFNLILVALLLIAVTAADAEELIYSEVQIPISSASDIRYLQAAGLGMDHFHVEAAYLQTVLDANQLRLLESLNRPFLITVPDMVAAYNARPQLGKTELAQLEQQMQDQYQLSGFSFGSMGGYYTLTELIIKVDSMRTVYPDLITSRASIGTSDEGRQIWMLKISDNPDVDEEEPEILYTALHHAREPQSMAAVVYFMYYLLENYGSDDEVTFLVDNRELYFVPVVNPDGYVYNESTNPNGGGFWRKNRRDNGDGNFGVDLNRNYGYFWGYDDIGSSGYTGSNTYRGPGPFSEPETQAVRDFAISRDFRLAFNYHGYGNLLIYPFGYEPETYTEDHPTFLELSVDMTQFNDYTYGTAWETVNYGVNGEANDWFYGEQEAKAKVFAWTPEVGTSFDGFWPSPDRIFPIAEENVYPNLRLAWGEGVIIGDAADPSPPSDPAAYSDYSTPGSIDLSWLDPTTLVSGLPLSPEDFMIDIQRDDLTIGSVPGGTGSFTDSGLEDGQLYSYSIYARLLETDSLSMAATASWTAGGARTPSPPTALACNDQPPFVVLSWSDPLTQSDGTPIDDLAEIWVWRDGAMVGSADGGEQTFTDSLPAIGDYSYTLTSVDNETPQNESLPSEAIICLGGPDEIAPLIEHVPLPYGDILDLPVLIDAMVTDDRGLDSVWVEYSLNGLAQEGFELSASGDLYSGSFPFDENDLGIGDICAYQIMAIDKSIEHNLTIEGQHSFDIRRNLVASTAPGLIIPANNEQGITDGLYVTAEGGDLVLSVDLVFKAIHPNLGDLSIILTSPSGTEVSLMDRPGFPESPLGNAGNDPDITLDDDGLISIEAVEFGNTEAVSGRFQPFPGSLSAFSGEDPTGEWTIRVSDQWPAFNGTFEEWGLVISLDYIGSVEEGTAPGLPTAFSLEQNYPNPFNPSTSFGFRVSDFGFVDIKVYDIQGRLVNTLVHRKMAPGNYTASWDGTNDAGSPVGSGVYFYRLAVHSALSTQHSAFEMTRKMVLLR